MCGTMIDEYWTWAFYGYHSDELKPFSHKPIVVICDDCCEYRVSMMHRDNGLCGSCRQKGRTFSDESRKKMSDSHKGVPLSDEHRKNAGISRLGWHHTDETKQQISKTLDGHSVSEETRRRSSATQQCIPYEKWAGFVKSGEYCEKFDEACRESNRDKYGRMCFVCGKPEEEEDRRLSVHHIDKNKDQGCDNNDWFLVPLCRSHHAKSHGVLWTARIEYLVKNVWNMV